MKSCYLKISSLLVLAFCLSSCGGFGIDRFGKRISCSTQISRTKCPVINDSNLSTRYGRFVLDAYNASGYINHATGEEVSSAGHYINSGNSANVVYTGGRWVLNDDGEYWLNGVELQFWCWAPETIASNGNLTNIEQTANSTTMEFDYTQTPAGAMDGLNHIDANNQKDIIFAYNGETRTINSNDKITSYSTTQEVTPGKEDHINIHFYHALAQINFAICTTDGSFDLDLLDNILLIEIRNAVGSAHCVFDGAAKDPETSFAWGEAVAHGDFMQTYTLENVGYGDGTAAPNGITYPMMNEMRDRQQSFFLIPQEFDEYSEIHVTFEYEDTDGKTTSLSRSVKLQGTDPHGNPYKWEAGKYYTYRINASTIGRDIKLEISLADWGQESDAIIV